MRNEFHNLIIKQDYILHKIGQKRHLVHRDFKIENTLVKYDTNDYTHLSGVLDWEHARADTIYGDIALHLEEIILLILCLKENL